eukprot:CAMPEP_0171628036 /NCGR_PEP_ID=MMETSP0990-20121206/21170_1 /TAXON_ID=483369 /ORGANISM="non described non described, Strain CCMP2098" /LENGTH=129 /DNA_ID=CAMNT_0012196089 /DNA_START=109 /DNA_END=498 /DNA_ORIENTATION=-
MSMRVRGMEKLSFQNQHVKWPQRISHFTTRQSSTGAGMDPLLRKRMDNLADLFVEARDELEMADESKGTTYYNEDSEQAMSAVAEAVSEYKSILASLEEPARGEFQRGNGLKMAQLEGELEMLLTDDDH